MHVDTSQRIPYSKYFPTAWDKNLDADPGLHVTDLTGGEGDCAGMFL